MDRGRRLFGGAAASPDRNEGFGGAQSRSQGASVSDSDERVSGVDDSHALVHAR